MNIEEVEIRCECGNKLILSTKANHMPNHKVFYFEPCAVCIEVAKNAGYDSAIEFIATGE